MESWKAWLRCIEFIKVDDFEHLKKEIELNPNLISLVDEDAETLLMVSADYSAEKCMQFLIDAHSDINQKNAFGHTALMYAVLDGDVKSVRFLLEHGAEISKRTHEGSSPLEIALKKDEKNQNYLWFNFFSLYKTKLDAKDLTLYKEHRIRALFHQKIL
jgi:ankyrin repeat protein